MHQQERATFYNDMCTSIEAKTSPLLRKVYECPYTSLHLLKVLVPSQESRRQQILIKILLSFTIVTTYLHTGIVTVTTAVAYNI